MSKRSNNTESSGWPGWYVVRYANHAKVYWFVHHLAILKARHPVPAQPPFGEILQYGSHPTSLEEEIKALECTWHLEGLVVPVHEDYEIPKASLKRKGFSSPSSWRMVYEVHDMMPLLALAWPTVTCMTSKLHKIFMTSVGQNGFKHGLFDMGVLTDTLVNYLRSPGGSVCNWFHAETVGCTKILFEGPSAKFRTPITMCAEFSTSEIDRLEVQTQQKKITSIGHGIRSYHFGQQGAAVTPRIWNVRNFTGRCEYVLQVWSTIWSHIVIAVNWSILHRPWINWLGLLFGSNKEPTNLCSLTLRTKRKSRHLHHLWNVTILLRLVATT